MKIVFINDSGEVDKTVKAEFIGVFKDKMPKKSPIQKGDLIFKYRSFLKPINIIYIKPRSLIYDERLMETFSIVKEK